MSLPIDEVLHWISLIFISSDCLHYWQEGPKYLLVYEESLSHCVCSARPEQLTFLTNGPRCPTDLESPHPTHCRKWFHFSRITRLWGHFVRHCTFLLGASMIYFFPSLPPMESSLLLTEGPIKSQSVLLHSCIMTKAVSVDLGSGAVPRTFHLLVYTCLILMTYVWGGAVQYPCFTTEGLEHGVI